MNTVNETKNFENAGYSSKTEEDMLALADGQMVEKNTGHFAGTVKRITPDICISGMEGVFYQLEISSLRTSGTADVVNALLPENMMDESIYVGSKIHLKAHLFSFTTFDESARHLNICIVADEVCLYTEDCNNFVLCGMIGRKGPFRVTPRGKEIIDFFMYVSDPSGHIRPIPSIAWMNDALMVNMLKASENLCVSGRFQSREYMKRYSDGITENRVAFEFSVSKLSYPG